MKYEVIIGLEFHIQLKTRSKMFCGCANDSESVAPNTNICPICLGHPGTLPVINEEAVRLGMKAGLALNCTIADFTKFDRKHYFYPDLPKGYQISQYDQPIATKGFLSINYKAGDGLAGQLDDETQLKRVGITRLHLEEDAAKNIHSTDGATLVDYNRSGSPLAEMVTDPDMSSAHEAKTFAQEVQLLMRHLDISDADMEKGQLRCDANISLRPVGDHKLYPKTEIKNLNSFRSIERALEFEIKRQKKLWEAGNHPETSETRGWHDDKQETFSQRSKESQADYRYFPEPDLPPLTISKEQSDAVKVTIGERPQEKRYRFMEEYLFTPEETKILTGDRATANYTERVISELHEWVRSIDSADGVNDQDWEKNRATLMKLVANWMVNNVFAIIKERAIAIAEIKMTAENFAEFITLIHQSKINSTNAQKMLQLMIETGGDPSQLMKDHALEQVDDDQAIAEIIEHVITNNPQQVTDYRAGKEQLLKFLLGQVMRESKGKVNPQKAETMLKRALQ